MRVERQVSVIGAVVVLALSAGCSSDDGDEEPSATFGSVPTSVVDTAPQHMLLNADGWERGEAVRPLTRPEAMERIEPSLDWWAEHERFEPILGGVEGADVRLSGHHVGLDDQASELVGFQATAGTVAGRRALFGTSSEGTPAVVLLELDPHYTIMVLSYALSVDELREVSEHLEPVSEDDWLAAGGQILECLPPDPGCSPTGSAVD